MPNQRKAILKQFDAKGKKVKELPGVSPSNRGQPSTCQNDRQGLNSEPKRKQPSSGEESGNESEKAMSPHGSLTPELSRVRLE